MVNLTEVTAPDDFVLQPGHILCRKLRIDQIGSIVLPETTTQGMGYFLVLDYFPDEADPQGITEHLEHGMVIFAGQSAGMPIEIDSVLYYQLDVASDIIGLFKKDSPRHKEILERSSVVNEMGIYS